MRALTKATLTECTLHALFSKHHRKKNIRRVRKLGATLPSIIGKKTIKNKIFDEFAATFASFLENILNQESLREIRQRVTEGPKHSPPPTTSEMPMDEDGEVVSDITYGRAM